MSIDLEKLPDHLPEHVMGAISAHLAFRINSTIARIPSTVSSAFYSTIGIHGEFLKCGDITPISLKFRDGPVKGTGQTVVMLCMQDNQVVGETLKLHEAQGHWELLTNDGKSIVTGAENCWYGHHTRPAVARELRRKISSQVGRPAQITLRVSRANLTNIAEQFILLGEALSAIADKDAHGELEEHLERESQRLGINLECLIGDVPQSEH